MLNRSCLPLALEDREFPDGFRASCQRYTQHYQHTHYLHYHSCLEIGLCLSGSGVEFIHEQIYPFSASSISIIQKGCIHDSHIIMPDPSNPPSQWKYIFVDLEALGVENRLTQSFNMYNKELTALFEMMFRELDEKPEGYEAMFRMLLPVFLAKVERLEPVPRPLKRSSMADEIASVINYIAQAYNTDLTVERLARECNMSVSYFRKVFRDNLGMCPQQYLIHVRLSMAEHLLRTTNKQILDISEEVGFHSLSSFNRLFQKAYGRSPRTFR